MAKRIFKLRNVVAGVVCLAGVMAFVTCKDKDPDKFRQECEKNNTGTLDLHNETGKTITITIDGKVYCEMEKGEIKPIELPVGTHTVKHDYPGCGGRNNEIEIEQCLSQIVFLMPC